MYIYSSMIKEAIEVMKTMALGNANDCMFSFNIALMTPTWRHERHKAIALYNSLPHVGIIEASEEIVMPLEVWGIPVGMPLPDESKFIFTLWNYAANVGIQCHIDGGLEDMSKNVFPIMEIYRASMECN